MFLSKKSLSHSHKNPFANFVFGIHGCRISSENIILRSFGEVGNYISLDDPIQMHTITSSVLSSMEMRSEVNELSLSNDPLGTSFFYQLVGVKAH